MLISMILVNTSYKHTCKLEIKKIKILKKDDKNEIVKDENKSKKKRRMKYRKRINQRIPCLSKIKNLIKRFCNPTTFLLTSKRNC